MSVYEKDSRKDSWVLSRFPFFLLRQFDDGAASFVFNLKHFFPYLVKNRNRVGKDANSLGEAGSQK